MTKVRLKIWEKLLNLKTSEVEETAFLVKLQNSNQQTLLKVCIFTNIFKKTSFIFGKIFA